MKKGGGSTARSASRNSNKMEKLNAGKSASVIVSCHIRTQDFDAQIF